MVQKLPTIDRKKIGPVLSTKNMCHTNLDPFCIPSVLKSECKEGISDKKVPALLDVVYNAGYLCCSILTPTNPTSVGHNAELCHVKLADNMTGGDLYFNQVIVPLQLVL